MRVHNLHPINKIEFDGPLDGFSEDDGDGDIVMNADQIKSDLDGSVEDDEVEVMGPFHDYAGYSGEDAKERMAHPRENSHGGHKTGALTDIGEGRSGVTVSASRAQPK